MNRNKFIDAQVISLLKLSLEWFWKMRPENNVGFVCFRGLKQVCNTGQAFMLSMQKVCKLISRYLQTKRMVAYTERIKVQSINAIISMGLNVFCQCVVAVRSKHFALISMTVSLHSVHVSYYDVVRISFDNKLQINLCNGIWFSGNSPMAL